MAFKQIKPTDKQQKNGERVKTEGQAGSLSSLTFWVIFQNRLEWQTSGMLWSNNQTPQLFTVNH